MEVLINDILVLIDQLDEHDKDIVLDMILVLGGVAMCERFVV